MWRIMSGLKKFGCGGLCEVSQMLDAGDYVRCLSLGIDASLRSIKIDLHSIPDPIKRLSSVQVKE